MQHQPRPWTRLTRPSWTSASIALRTVPLARPCSCISVASEAMIRPGGNSPDWIWARKMLASEGIPARGVDWNRLMVAECRERRLTVEQAEALDYLARVADGSLGAVTVLRLVEQLPFRQLVRLLDEVARVLRPGGTAIFDSATGRTSWWPAAISTKTRRGAIRWPGGRRGHPGGSRKRPDSLRHGCHTPRRSGFALCANPARGGDDRPGGGLRGRKESRRFL